MNRKSISISVLVIAAVVLSVFTVQTLRVVAAPTLDEALTIVAACNQQKNSIMCSRPIVKKLLETTMPAEIMDALAKRFKPAQCHYVGHVVGQMTYVQTQNIETALSRCTRACDSACVHGAIGEVFAEKMGLGTPDQDTQVDLLHLSENEMRAVGRSLCTDAETCHGIGHAIFQIKSNLPEAMALCVAIDPAYLSSCFNGAAMEYADILASRNMREVANVAPADTSTIVGLCTSLPNIIQQRSCFRYYPRMVEEAYEALGRSPEEAAAQVAKICVSYKSKTIQSACFSGIGSHSAYFVLTDQDAAVKVCQAVQDRRNQAGCYFGQIAVAVEERQNKLVSYCARLPDTELQSLCYQIVFYYLNRFGASSDNVSRNCGRDNLACQQGRKNFRTNPWDTILEKFN